MRCVGDSVGEERRSNHRCWEEMFRTKQLFHWGDTPVWACTCLCVCVCSRTWKFLLLFVEFVLFFYCIMTSLWNIMSAFNHKSISALDLPGRRRVPLQLLHSFIWSSWLFKYADRWSGACVCLCEAISLMASRSHFTERRNNLDLFFMPFFDFPDFFFLSMCLIN